MFAICVVMCMIQRKAIRTTVFNRVPLLTPFRKIGFVHFAALPSRTSHPKTKPLIAKRSERKGTMQWSAIPSECRQRKVAYLAPRGDKGGEASWV